MSDRFIIPCYLFTIFFQIFPISKLSILILEEQILVEYKLGSLQRFLMPSVQDGD